MSFFKSLFLLYDSAWHLQNTFLLENPILQTLKKKKKAVLILHLQLETVRRWKEYFIKKVLGVLWADSVPGWLLDLSKREEREWEVWVIYYL